MKKPVIIMLLLLIIFIGVKPALGAEYLELTDLKISIEGKKDCYSPNDKLAVTITIEPESDEIAKKMENRDYTFYNYLNAPRNMEITFVAKETYVPYTKATAKETLTFKDYEISSGYGVDHIEINVTGYVPSIEGGIEEFTFFKIIPQDGDSILFNITIVEPSKLEDELKDLEEKLNELKSEIDELGRFINVESLNEKYDEISRNITLAKDYYNEGEYEKVSKKISRIKSAIDDLEDKLKEKKADYYLTEAKNMINDIDALILKADSYITVAESSGKANDVMEYKLNLTQIKYRVEDLKDSLKDIQKLYDDGKYGEVIDNAKDFIDEAKDIKLQLSIMVSSLQSVLKTKGTPTPTSEFSFKLDTKMLTYIGIGVAVIVCGGIAAVAISRWRQRRKWDELR